MDHQKRLRWIVNLVLSSAIILPRIDNMGTGIMNLEGPYNPATKSLTYFTEYEPMPGMKTKIREVVTKTDEDHHSLEFFEDRGGKEVKAMQIDYTRKN